MFTSCVAPVIMQYHLPNVMGNQQTPLSSLFHDGNNEPVLVEICTMLTFFAMVCGLDVVGLGRETPNYFSLASQLMLQAPHE
jgi:hypothetical protein